MERGLPCQSRSQFHPGLLAPASLKRDLDHCGPPRNPGFHPGLLAPASLKHGGTHGVQPGDTEFHPGLLAPASLKPAGGMSPGPGAGVSSGAACPGLIEALFSSDSS